MIGHQWKTAHISVIMPATIPPRLLICLPFLFIIMLLLSPRDQKGEKTIFFWQKLNDSILDFRHPQLSVLKWSLLGGQVQLHFIWRIKIVIILSVKIFWRAFKVRWHPIAEQNRSCEVFFENSILFVQVVFRNNTCTIKVPDKGYFPSVIKVKKDVCSLILSKLQLKRLFQTDCDGRLGNQLSVYATAWVTCH